MIDCVNLLIHREFIEPFYARLIIEKDVLRTENANKARMIGDIFKTEIPLVRIEETATLTIPTTTPTTVLTETQQQIIRLIKENNKITREEIANKIGITKSGVQYNLNILKKNNYIRRVGRTYKGYWEILQ